MKIVNYFVELRSSFTSISSTRAISRSVATSGWDVLVHHLEMVAGFLPKTSASHLLVFFFSTRIHVVHDVIFIALNAKIIKSPLKPAIPIIILLQKCFFPLFVKIKSPLPPYFLVIAVFEKLSGASLILLHTVFSHNVFDSM